MRDIFCMRALCLASFRSCLRVYWLSVHSMMEVIRQKFFWIVLWMILALFMSSALLQFIDLSDQNVKFIADFGVGMIQLLGTLLVVVLSVQLFSSGFENGTIWTLLSKPMLAVEYVVAKFCAIQLLMLVCLTLMSGTLAWQLYLYAGAADELQYLAIAKYGFLQWLKFSIFSSLALMLAAIFRQTLLAIMLSLLCLLISHLRVVVWGPSSFDFREGASWMRAISQCVPDNRLFQWPTAAFTGPGDLPALDYSLLIVYALTYCVLYLSVAIWGFKKRQFNSLA